MKKYLIYLAVLAVGLILGWVLFGSVSNNDIAHSDQITTAGHEHNSNGALFTCSMHPQIMRSELGDCPICGMDLIPSEAGADGLTKAQFKLTENAMALANIQTTTIAYSDTDENVISLSGKIVENEEDNTTQVSYFSGRIERLNIGFTGESIKKGQLLATIYSPELYSAQQELITASSFKASQPALYNAVRNKLKLWKLSDNQISQIEQTGKVKEQLPIYATVSGTVIEKLVEQGDVVKQGQPLLKIANLNSVWANFDVYEQQIDAFSKHQDVTVYTNAYPNMQFEAKVGFIDPMLNSKTRTVTLRVELNNEKALFKPGMFVEAKIKTLKAIGKQKLSVPASSVLWTGERSVIYLKTNANEPIFEMREVVLGNKLGEQYEVIEGVFEGNEIVTNGTFTVDAAAQLQGKKSMMNNSEHINMPKDTNLLSKRSEVPVKFQDQLRLVFDTYTAIREALLKNDVAAVIKTSNQLPTAIGQVSLELLPTLETKNKWEEVSKNIEASASSLAKVSDIDAARNQFNSLSGHFNTALQLYGVNKKVYYHFCPMVANNKGGFWLSYDEAVSNPYFGGDMIACGEVKGIIL